MNADDHGEPDTFQTPSRAQELALVVLPIPSAILSIVGSSIIIASTTLGMAALLRDKDSSTRPFSFGSSGTCTMVGFLNQLGYGTLFYNGSLSLYFFLTVRFGYSNAYIARVVEPWMHVIGNGFAFSTSIVALALGAYGEMTQANGCWIADYPRGCGDGANCTSRLIGWLYFGIPSISIFILVFVFNLLICMFVRRHKIPPRQSTPEARPMSKQTDRDDSSSNGEQTECGLARSENNKEINDAALETEIDDSQTTQSRDQARRLRLVSTQACSYVAFFFMCNVWTGTVASIEMRGSTKEEEIQLVADYYVFFLLQAVLAPLQGVFNLAVFIRPKLYLCRMAFPEESRLWIFRRTILGDRVKPTCPPPRPSRALSGRRGAAFGPSDYNENDKIRKSPPPAKLLERDMVSSVSASEGDFNSEERWANKGKSYSSILSSIPIRFESLVNPKSSVLEIISENEASTFEPISRISIAAELVRDMSSGDFFPNPETRWASDSSGTSATTQRGSPTPEKMVDDLRKSISSRQHQSHEPSIDQPIKVPQRSSMPDSPGFERKKLNSELQNLSHQDETVSSREEDCMPQTHESVIEEPDQSSSFRHLNPSSCDRERVSLPADQPIKAPKRCSEPNPQTQESLIEEPDSSSSFRHLNRSSCDKEPVALPADQPIKAPKRCSEPIPQAKESLIEEPDQSSSFRHLNRSSSSEKSVDLPADQPIKAPKRCSEPIPQAKESLIEEPDLSSSFRHLIRSSPRKEPSTIPADQPMKIPQRRSMPDSPSFVQKKTPKIDLQSTLRQVPETHKE